MALESMDHLSIRTTKMEETREFYETAMGMTNGDRPPLPFPGYWMYLDDVDLDDLDGSGAVDHLAFRASDPQGLITHLNTMGIPYRQRKVPEMNLFQLFLEDPNNITLELNYFE